jgi:hypothetical protein
MRLLRTPAFRSSVGALDRGQTVDRDDIAGLDAGHDDRPGDRRQGLFIASRREWCRYHTDILDIVEGAANLDPELPPESMVIALAKVRGTAPHARYSSPRVRGQGECGLESLRSHRSRLHGPAIYIKIAEPPARLRLDDRRRALERLRKIALSPGSGMCGTLPAHHRSSTLLVD